MQTTRALLLPVFFFIACGSNATVPPASPAAASASAVPPDAGAPSAGTLAQTGTELWEGALAIGPSAKLRLVLHVTREKDGVLHATCDSVDQGALGIPVDTITRDERTLAFTMRSVGAEYAGMLNQAGTSASGEFKQRGGALPLTLTKTDKPSAPPSRPQTPKPPFSYHAEDVTYSNAAGRVTLAGTLTIPAGEGPFPAAILITGSGAQDRDETLFDHKPFLVLADDLTRKGVAVLRVDDRGVGGSTGDLKTSTSSDLAGDVLAGIAFLKGRKEIDPARVGLIGHSEGGLIAPLVAGQSKDVAFVVMLAGPGLPGREILKLQQALIARASGVPEAEIAQVGAVNDRIFAALADARDDKDAEARVRAILKKLASDPAMKSPPDADTIVARVANPWFRYFVKYDPRPALAKLKCPALALNGEKDLQVPPKEDLAAIAKANPRIVTKELPGLNHLFQTATIGSPAEYGTIEETMAPAALEEISAFVLEKTHKK